MKVFVSWSGDNSREIASAISEWLPNVIQQVRAFMSNNSIIAGERWHGRIDTALFESDFGLLIVNSENMDKPWLVYEAGALAKNVSVSRVIPILVDIGNEDLKKSPLSHFQSIPLEKAGMMEVVNSIYLSCEDTPLSDVMVISSFETWWPKLAKKLKEIEPPKKTAAKKPPTPDDRFNNIEDSISGIYNVLQNFNRSGKAEDKSRISSASAIRRPKVGDPEYDFKRRLYIKYRTKIPQANSESELLSLSSDIGKERELIGRHRRMLMSKIETRSDEIKNN